MLKLIPSSVEEQISAVFDTVNFSKKRNPTSQEVEILRNNNNFSSDTDFKNLFVEDDFDANLIKNSEFSGKIVIGKLQDSLLQYHDLKLKTGIINSSLNNCVLGDDVCVKNVSYLENYSIGNRVILFNIQEMSCTLHSKFGNGVLKENEPEQNRIWIGVGNENDYCRCIFVVKISWR